MKKFVKVFDNKIVWETTGNLTINIPNASAETIDVSDKSEAEIEKIKSEKIDKEPS